MRATLPHETSEAASTPTRQERLHPSTDFIFHGEGGDPPILQLQVKTGEVERGEGPSTHAIKKQFFPH